MSLVVLVLMVLMAGQRGAHMLAKLRLPGRTDLVGVRLARGKLVMARVVI